MCRYPVSLYFNPFNFRQDWPVWHFKPAGCLQQDALIEVSEDGGTGAGSGEINSPAPLYESPRMGTYISEHLSYFSLAALSLRSFNEI